MLQRAGYTVGGLVLVAGAIAVLRNTDTPASQKPLPVAPVQTTVRAYADEGVLVPQSGPKPPPPEAVRTIRGLHRLQVTWTKSAEMAGYEVQIHGSDTDRTKLVVGDAAQFDALNDSEYEISVRAMDAFGQRSDPVQAKDRPTAKPSDDSRYPLLDHFDGQIVPDPARWRLANNAACARMARGAGEDSKRMVIKAACGNESVALRSRTPLRPKDNTGRVMIETDAPGSSGEMILDLVPGPADLIETSPRNAPPPGTIRVRVTSATVEIPGAQPIPMNPLRDGVSVRWEFELAGNEIRVWRDGVLLGSAPVATTWTEATPLFEFTGPPNGLTFVAIDAIGLSNDGTPPFAPPPRVNANGAGGAGMVRLLGLLGAQLRMTIRSSYGEVMPGPFTVEVNSRTFPARPAITGQPFESGLRYPIVVDLPADVLVVNDRDELPVRVHSANPSLAPQVQHADIELIPDAPPPRLTTDPAEPIARPTPTLPATTVTLLDAAGGKIEGRTSPRGRIVLDITTNGSGLVNGMAGVEIWVDSKRIAGIPTNRDGPGVGGHWRVALNTGSFQPGVRDIELRSISADGNANAQFTTIPWQIPS